MEAIIYCWKKLFQKKLQKSYFSKQVRIKIFLLIKQKQVLNNWSKQQLLIDLITLLTRLANHASNH